jgi:hypothetical protein
MRSTAAQGALFADTMPSDLGLDVEAERVVGPINGYWIACYSVQSDEGYFAYAKAYTEALACVWNTPSPVAKYAAGPFESGEIALEAVIQKCDLDLRQRVSKANRLLRWLGRYKGGAPPRT